MPRPSMALKLRVKRFSALGMLRFVAAVAAGTASESVTEPPMSRVADPRVEEPVEQVDDEVEQYEDQGHGQHGSLHEREVAGEDRVHGQAPEAGPGEHGLRQHRAAQQRDRKSTRLNS